MTTGNWDCSSSLAIKYNDRLNSISVWLDYFMLIEFWKRPAIVVMVAVLREKRLPGRSNKRLVEKVWWGHVMMMLMSELMMMLMSELMMEVMLEVAPTLLPQPLGSTSLCLPARWVSVISLSEEKLVILIRIRSQLQVWLSLTVLIWGVTGTGLQIAEASVLVLGGLPPTHSRSRLRHLLIIKTYN